MERMLIISNNSHADFQVLTICEDESTKICNTILSNSEETIVEKIKIET